MASIQEQYKPVILAANASVISNSMGVGGFLCITSGTLTISKNTQAGTIIVNAMPVTAGTWVPMPLFVGTDGMVITAAGGASGVLGVN